MFQLHFSFVCVYSPNETIILLTVNHSKKVWKTDLEKQEFLTHYLVSDNWNPIKISLLGYVCSTQSSSGRR